MVRKRRPAKSTATATAVALTLMAGSATAAIDDARAMPLGRVAPAPEGFLSLCERSPQDCPAIGDVPDGRTLRAEANRRFWEAAFPSPVPARTAPPAAISIKAGLYDLTDLIRPLPRLYPLDTPLVVKIADVTSEVDPADAVTTEAFAVSAVEVAAVAMSHEASAAGDFVAVEGLPAVRASGPIDGPQDDAPQPLFALDRDGWRLVNSVNRRMNRGIRNASDTRLHGREDHWVVPKGEAPQGDCEDYVLAKRASLIEAGVPAAALSIAIVETAWGESHAVLLLASDQGEYVLDNLSPWVSRWDRVNYRWRERQVPGRPFDWVSVAL